jgi:hypothetical protein
MKYQVGDILETSKKDFILIAEIVGDLIVGYWGADYLRNIGYTTYINEKVKSGSWKHYPVVK